MLRCARNDACATIHQSISPVSAGLVAAGVVTTVPKVLIVPSVPTLGERGNALGGLGGRRRVSLNLGTVGTIGTLGTIGS